MTDETKQHLADVIDSVRNGDTEAANKAFKQYTTAKTQEILHPETTEVSDASEEKVE